MSTPITALLLAFSMLTRLPLHPRGDVTPRALRLSVMFYPYVGLCLGGLIALLVPWLRLLPVHMAGLLTVALLALLTGGLHLDGLADWFDALGGGRGDRNRMLDIMKDSRIGAHGATALVLLLIGKCASFDAAIDVLTRAQWIAVPVFSRFAIVPLVVWMRPARDQGLAHSVHGEASFVIVLGALLPVAGLLALGPLVPMAIALLTAIFTAAWIGVWAQRRLGGATGDVYGAALELAELTTMIALMQCNAS